MGRIKKNVYENIYYFDFYFLHKTIFDKMKYYIYKNCYKKTAFGIMPIQKE